MLFGYGPVSNTSDSKSFKEMFNSVVNAIKSFGNAADSYLNKFKAENNESQNAGESYQSSDGSGIQEKDLPVAKKYLGHYDITDLLNFFDITTNLDIPNMNNNVDNLKVTNRFNVTSDRADFIGVAEAGKEAYKAIKTEMSSNNDTILSVMSIHHTSGWYNRNGMDTILSTVTVHKDSASGVSQVNHVGPSY